VWCDSHRDWKYNSRGLCLDCAEAAYAAMLEEYELRAEAEFSRVYDKLALFGR
jgi:hypothetical protein